MKRLCFSLFSAIAGLIFVTASSSSAELEIPSNYSEPQAAITAATDGVDNIVITQAGTYDGFVLDKDVPITNTSGGVVVIDAGNNSDAFAVRITDPDGSIDGLKLRARSGGTGILDLGAGSASNCVLEDNGYALSNDGAVKISTGSLTNSTIDVTSGQGRAVAISSASAYVYNNTINVTLTSANTRKEGIYCSGANSDVYANTITFSGADKANGIGIEMPNGSSGADIRDNVINEGDFGIHVSISSGSATVEDNVVYNADSGIYLGQGSNHVVRGNTVARATCSSGSYGIEVSTLLSTTLSTFENNLLVNVGTGMFFGQAVAANWTIDHNIFYSEDSPTCGTDSNKSLTATELSTKAVIFCDGREGTGDFTHRIDSPASTGNNGWSEQVGAFGVECAWDTLAYDATVPNNSNITVLEDVTVLSGKTLTIGNNATFSFDEDDNSEEGSDTDENELTVAGTLDINGTSGNEVEFISSASSPVEGGWYGIRVTGGTTNIDHAIIKHAENGVVISGGSSYVDEVTFSENLSYDVSITSTSVDTSEITNCTLTVGDGSGIYLKSNDVLIKDNNINCSGDTFHGIEVVLDGSNNLLPQIIGNTIKDFTNGNGILVAGETPYIMKNTIKDGKWGIYLTGGAAKIGDSSDNSSDNTITGNTRGIYSNCTGPGSCPTCSGFAPVVRESNISSNTTGVYVSKRGFIDLGNATQNGDNTFTSNTAYCIRNVANCDSVTAVGNWYGAHPPIVCWGGDVDVTGPLTSAPASFGDIGIERQDGPVGPLAVQGLWPNPVRSSATVQFRTTEDVEGVEMQIFDVAGRLVWSGRHATRAAGVHEFVWDGTNEQGKQVTDGIYFVRLTADGKFHQNARLMVVR